MDNPNRINPTALTVTTPRQTPQNDFGQVMARTVSGVVQIGASVAGAFVPGAPVASAAISGVAGLAAGFTQVSSRSTVGPTGTGGIPGTAGAAGGSTAKGENWDLMEAQKLLNQDQQKFNLAYLQLQNDMQKESREFTTLSNIMKVRHDSAKAAINNIR